MFHSPRLILLVMLAIAAPVTLAQNTPKKLPSADKIVENYLKAIGGKKTAGARKDATYEWVVQLNDRPIVLAITLSKAPAS